MYLNLHVFFPLIVSSNTAALTSSATTLLSTLQPVLTSKALHSSVAITSSVTTLLPTLQPVLTSKAPQSSYLNTLHFHTLHTVLPSSSQYKSTISPEPVVSTIAKFSPSVIPTSSTNSEHTTVYQTASVPRFTPTVTPTDSQPIAGMSLHHVAHTEQHCMSTI